MSARRVITRAVTTAVAAIAAVSALLVPAASARPADRSTARQETVVNGLYRIADPAGSRFLAVWSAEPRARVTVVESPTGVVDSGALWRVECQDLLGCTFRNERTGTYLALTGVPVDGKPVITKVTPYRWLLTAASGMNTFFISRFAGTEEFRVTRSPHFVHPPLVDLTRPGGPEQEWALTSPRPDAR
ncbi:hypothetical protein AB0425_41690 [Actinosynnema sp. NPDC051121]